MSKKERESKVTVEHLMTTDVLFASPTETVATLRKRMVEEGISALPVTDGEGKLLGIVTATDVLRSRDHELPTAEIMSDHVYTLPPYAKVDIAARLMRNHGIHHVVITHESKVTGMLASYDLLALIESHRYVAKGAPGRKNRGGGRRRKMEKELAKARRAAEALPKGAPPPAEITRERLNTILGTLSRRAAAVERSRSRADEPLVADFAEQAVVRENDEVLDALSREGRGQLELIGRALERLDEGDYGSCEDCKLPIPGARLEALPFAVTCVDCARKRETAVI